MQFYYGKLMPLRVLDEMESWKRREIRHAMLMRELVVYIEDRLVTACHNWEETITITHQHIKRFMKSISRGNWHITPQLHQQTLDMVTFSLQESMAFKQFCQNVMNESDAVMNNHVTRIVITHLIDEVNDVITTAQRILYDDEN